MEELHLTAPTEPARTGIEGLDEILRGGLPRDFIYLIQGDPGSGKTTLSLQFLLEGARQGERCLYLTLAESRRELERVARSHNWDLTGVEIFEHPVGEEILKKEQDTTLFHPAEVELGKTVDALLKKVDEVRPHRLVVDSLSEIRLLSQTTLRYRKQVLALKQFFGSRNTTVLLIDDRTSEGRDIELHSVPHGVIVLERHAPIYGAARRRLEVVKLRGQDFRGGYHDFNIFAGGLAVYPRLVASEHKEMGENLDFEGLVPGIDKMIGGGLHRGASTVVMGPAGVGKSSLVTQYAVALARRKERVVFFVFDESRRTLLMRSKALGFDLQEYIDNGTMVVRQLDPAEVTPGEFAHLVRREVEDNGVSMIVIDSLNGYLNAMPEERFLTLHLHELLSYLTEKGVASLLVVAQHGVQGRSSSSSIDVSYLADAVILMRFYEMRGEILKAISILKKRSGWHDKSIRDFELVQGEGFVIGERLSRLRGILTGAPVHGEMLMADEDDEESSDESSDDEGE